MLPAIEHDDFGRWVGSWPTRCGPDGARDTALATPVFPATTTRRREQQRVHDRGSSRRRRSCGQMHGRRRWLQARRVSPRSASQLGRREQIAGAARPPSLSRLRAPPVRPRPRSGSPRRRRRQRQRQGARGRRRHRRTVSCGRTTSRPRLRCRRARSYPRSRAISLDSPCSYHPPRRTRRQSISRQSASGRSSTSRLAIVDLPTPVGPLRWMRVAMRDYDSWLAERGHGRRHLDRHPGARPRRAARRESAVTTYGARASSDRATRGEARSGGRGRCRGTG